jgi:hypothetical protein
MAEKFKTKTILLAGPVQVQTVLAAVPHLPLGIEVVFREPVKVRGLDANARMWVGPLKDLAEQAWIGGRQYSAEIWHEHFKALYLPEENDPELADLVKDPETWKKWDYTPSGDRICIGSTTRLTQRGFSIYLEQVHADGAGLGVLFSASPNEYGRK